MSESNSRCPVCRRWPGVPHSESCPRSRKRQRRLQLWAADRSQARPVWPFGQFALALPRGRKIVENPGVPCAKAPKLASAGGLPGGARREPALRFLRQLAEAIQEREQ